MALKKKKKKGKNKSEDRVDSREDTILQNQELPMDENRKRFLRLCEPRVNKALRAMELVANISNKRNYEYTKEEAEAVLAALRDAYNKICSGFSGTDEFRLP